MDGLYFRGMKTFEALGKTYVIRLPSLIYDARDISFSALI
jgi:hypothetical protein